jgi:toxin YoeB
MNFEFTNKAWEDFTYWIDNDKDIIEKIRELLKAIKQDPFKGIGKPEALKFDLKGYWSRRITGEHRLFYFRHKRLQPKMHHPPMPLSL